MRKRMVGTVVVSALALLGGACGDGEDTTGQAEQEARETVTSVQQQAEAATRFTATLSGTAEVPRSGDPDGGGNASVNIDATKGELCYEVTAQRIDRPTAMHVHEGAAGKSGPVVVPLTAPTASDTLAKGCANADRTLLARIVAKPTDFYVNVHSQAYPDGAVRGQLSQ